MYIKNFLCLGGRKPVLPSLILGLMLVILPATTLYSQSCEQELREANTKFRDGEIEEAVSLIATCLSKDNLSDSDEIAANMLLGKVYVSLDDTVQAKFAFTRMLQVDSKITLDPSQETPDVIRIFNSVKAGFKPPQELKPAKPFWPYVVVGAGVAGGVAAVLLFAGGGGGGNGDGGFPLPLGRPSGN